MGRRALLAALLAVTPVADAAGSHRLAFWALVAAVPAAAACALASFGEHLDGGDDLLRGLQALLWAPATLLLLAAAVARGPMVAAGRVPQLGVTAFAACVFVLALKLALHGGAQLWRTRAVPAPKPVR